MRVCIVLGIFVTAGLGAWAEGADVQGLFNEAAAAIEAGQYGPARDLFEQSAAMEGIEPGMRSLAKLRVIDCLVLEQRYEDAARVCEDLARLEGIPPHHKWEAGQCLEGVKRTQAGLPPRDPEATRVKIEPAPSPAAVFFIGPNGADSADGTQQAPFATFARALDAVRALKQSAPDRLIPPGGVMLMGEQDSDRRAWGGACSKLGGVAAMFYAAGGGDKYREIAYRNLTWVTYFIRDDGVPCDQTGEPRVREGGWQEDCHTDVVHNFVDAWRTGAF